MFRDAVAVDLNTGLARSFIPGAVGPTSSESFSGLVDTTVGVACRVVDELVSNAPSVAVRAAVIAAGSYETGHINSLGDGGNGFGTSVLVGKFGTRVGFSAEAGYRYRTEDIPSDIFANLSAFFPITDRLTCGADWRIVNGNASGLDIGGPGFLPTGSPKFRRTPGSSAAGFWPPSPTPSA